MYGIDSGNGYIYGDDPAVEQKKKNDKQEEKNDGRDESSDND